MNVQFLHEAGAMVTRRLGADVQSSRDLFCGFSLDDKHEHFPLTNGELSRPCGSAGPADLHYRLRKARAYIDAALGHLPKSLYEIVYRLTLEH